MRERGNGRERLSACGSLPPSLPIVIEVDVWVEEGEEGVSEGGEIEGGRGVYL